MNKRPLILRAYQEGPAEFALNNDIAILGVAPNGGKTEISIYVLVKYLELNPTAKVLILTHSTNVLKNNYTTRLDKLDLPFEYTTTFNLKIQVHVCLPHGEKHIKGKYDFVIVDEAHENYLADRVQRIIDKVKPSKQLLLTGTPARFIRRGGYKIFTLAANAIPSEYFAKLQVELIAANYDWAKQLNNDLEVKKDYKFKKQDSEDALEQILVKLLERVTLKLTAEEFNNPSFMTALKKQWKRVYEKLGKTIIICRSIKQANDVNQILQARGVKSNVSESETDPDSLEITNFKEGKYDVLVVVDRARLGYSDDDLFNIIDMSGTHNPNMIYQIFARVLRGNPDMQKYYLKVTSQEYGMMDFTHACVSAALMLTDNKYLSTFNGDNFKGIKIPVIKRVKTSGSGNGGSIPPNKVNKKFIFPEFTHDVIDMFRNIIHNLDEPVSIYKLTTIGDVRTELNGRTVWTKDAIFESARGY